jgi:hypothetical protein
MDSADEHRQWKMLTASKTNMIGIMYNCWMHEGKRYRMYPMQISHTTVVVQELQSVLWDGSSDKTRREVKSDDIDRLYTMRRTTYPMDMLRCNDKGGCTATTGCDSNNNDGSRRLSDALIVHSGMA